MITRLTAGALALGIFVVWAGTFHSQSSEDKRLLSGVVRLEVKRIGGEPDIGSGIFLGTENGTAYILTALHVLVGPEEERNRSGWERKTNEIGISVEFYGEPRQFAGKMFDRWNKARDLAIVTVAHPQVAELGIAVAYGVGSPSTLSPPYPVLAIGNGGRTDWNRVNARVTAASEATIAVSGSGIVAGFSGGALIDTTRHLLIGMLTAVTLERSDAVSTDNIIADMDSWRVPHHLRKTRISTPMIRVPQGMFSLSPESGSGLSTSKREIYLDAYFIDKYEVTVEQFDQFVKDTGYGYKPGVATCNFGQKGRENYPMNCVTWQDAQAFATWAGKELPTEAQWAKAAMGTTGRRLPWGTGEPRAADAAILIEWPVAVGSYNRDMSAYGVMDMLGNVSEWVADWYHRDFLENLSSRNPTGPPSGEDRVLRGSSFETPRDKAVLTSRLRDLPASGRMRFDYGFRCALNER